MRVVDSPFMRRVPGWAANLALVSASLLLTALAVEAAARVFVELQARRSERSATPTTRYHAVLGWQRVPGTELRVVRPEFDVKLSFNARGLRGPDVPYERPAGVRRVLLLGDSFAEGYYVEEPQTVRALLERLLKMPPAAGGAGSPADRGRCGRVQVVNGGMGGYSTDQEYLFYTTEGHRYGAELTVVFFYYNDLLYNTSPTGTSELPKPVFVPQPDGTLNVPDSLVPPESPRAAAGQDPAAPRLRLGGARSPFACYRTAPWTATRRCTTRSPSWDWCSPRLRRSRVSCGPTGPGTAPKSATCGPAPRRS